jgi:hypothetical protein
MAEFERSDDSRDLESNASTETAASNHGAPPIGPHARIRDAVPFAI